MSISHVTSLNYLSLSLSLSSVLPCQAGEVQPLVARRSSNGVPSIDLEIIGDDADSAGYYGGDCGRDDVHARLVP